MILISGFLLLSFNVIFSAALQTPPTTEITHTTQKAIASLQRLCADTIVKHRISCRALPAKLQLLIAPNERVYLEETQRHDDERRRQLARLQEEQAYTWFINNTPDTPDHISQLFPILHDRYLTVSSNSSYSKKCLTCLAINRITPEHGRRFLRETSYCALATTACITPAIFPATTVCCPALSSGIFGKLVGLMTTEAACLCANDISQNRCKGYTQQCYGYLTEPEETPRPLVMEQFLAPELSLD